MRRLAAHCGFVKPGCQVLVRVSKDQERDGGVVANFQEKEDHAEDHADARKQSQTWAQATVTEARSRSRCRSRCRCRCRCGRRGHTFLGVTDKAAGTALLQMTGGHRATAGDTLAARWLRVPRDDHARAQERADCSPEPARWGAFAPTTLGSGHQPAAGICRLQATAHASPI